MIRTQRPRALCVLVLMALVLVALPVAPAAADHEPPGAVPGGNGRLEGTESVQQESYTGTACFATAKSVFTLNGAGTYYGRQGDGQQVVYRAQVGEDAPLWRDGPLTVEVENKERYYHGPGGTYGSAPCPHGAPTAPVAAFFRIFAADHVYRLDEQGRQVPCRGDGSFKRGDMNGEINWRADWALTEDCVVVGNEAGTPGAGVAAAGTTHVHHGSHAGSSGDSVDNFKVDYTQYPAIVGPHATMVGPASASVGNPVKVTARLTNDGVPVPNTAVSFSVVGPDLTTPPSAVAPTGDDGRASFTFTATAPGDYTVTASASHAGQAVSATHAIRFSAAATTMSMAGPSWAQTQEKVTTTATLTHAGNPVPGAVIDFAVAGPGQANPPSQTVVSDNLGRASFTFSADRAGDYTVTASTTHPLGDASATHAVRLDINTFYRDGTLSFPSGEGRFASPVMDPAGRFAYFGSRGNSSLVKIDLATFARVGAVSLGSSAPSAGVISPDGRYAYFATGASPSRVVKVDLTTFQQAGAIDAGNAELRSAVIDPAGRFAYFGSAHSPGRVLKIDLGTFQKVGELVFEPGEGIVESAVIDPAGNYAYFGASGGQSSTATGGKVVKVDLNTFQRVGAVNVVEALDDPLSKRLLGAVIDPAGNYAYFGTVGSRASIVKIDLKTFGKAGAIETCCDQAHHPVLGPVGAPSVHNVVGVMDPAGKYAYFGTDTASTEVSSQVMKIDLATFQRVHALPVGADIYSGVIDPLGNYAYFGSNAVDHSLTQTNTPGQVFRVAVSRPPNPALVVADDAYDTPYLTPLEVAAPGVLGNDGPGLSAHNASDPPGGSVVLNPDGSFSYTPDEGFSGTDTFTYVASDGTDYSAPATVSVEVAPSPEGVRGSAFGYYSEVSLFGGPKYRRGYGQVTDPTCNVSNASCAPPSAESPSVELPRSGGSVSDTDPDGATARYGPATIFSSGAQQVASEGNPGSAGSVTTSANIANVNASGDEVFTAESAASTCEATASGVSATTSITNGTLRTSEGDPNVDGDDTVVEIPANPAPNTVYKGQLESVGDHFEYIFNKQVVNPDGSITVYAAHQRLLGPTAIGDLYIGKAECGITLGSGGTPNQGPTAADDAYTTKRGTALEVPAPGVLDNDTDADGDALTATSPSDPANGSVVLNGDGSFTYTPDARFVGTDTFTYTADDGNGGTATATVTMTVEAAAAKARVADFDGDGDSDRSVFRKGAWYAQGQPAAFFGVSGDVPVPGDYDGDGTTDRAVYRNGAWHIAGQPTVFLGNATDIPVPGDYDGDGDTEAAVYRNGAWHIHGQPTVFLGNASDTPVPGDYDGDGDIDRAIYRNGAWYVAGQPTVFLGNSSDIPVPGDYDGDGTTDRGVYRRSVGAWHVQGQPTVFLGTSGDVPVPGDYDADASTDRGVFRPSAGGWYVQGQPNAFLGVKGDIPLPLPQAIYRVFFSGA